jgi:50S ribosomal subunit-associated GTPase HflX
VIEGNRRYVRCLYVYNKVDMVSLEEVDEIARRPHSVPVSCSMNLNMDGLLSRMWDMMALVRLWLAVLLCCMHDVVVFACVCCFFMRFACVPKSCTLL